MPKGKTKKQEKASKKGGEEKKDEGCANGGAARPGKRGCLEERPGRDTKHKTVGPDFANEAQERMKARGNEAKASIWNKIGRGEGRGKGEEAGNETISEEKSPGHPKKNRMTLPTQPNKFAIKRKRRSFALGFVLATATIPRSVAQLGIPKGSGATLTHPYWPGQFSRQMGPSL